jgi:hypothetical protein
MRTSVSHWDWTPRKSCTEQNDRLQTAQGGFIRQVKVVPDMITDVINELLGFAHVSCA